MTTDHDRVLMELAKHFQPVLEKSPDGVYLWLDETHMVCNAQLARMFGYTLEEMNAHPPFLATFVAEQDQENFAWNYQNRVVPLAFPVTFRFTALSKDGSTFRAETDMIPISFDGHSVAYHFVRQVG